MPCKCADSTTCHNPDSHRMPIRFAEESDAPEFLCIDCGEVEVSDLNERCAECWCCHDDDRRDAEADHLMDLAEGR